MTEIHFRFCIELGIFSPCKSVQLIKSVDQYCMINITSAIDFHSLFEVQTAALLIWRTSISTNITTSA